VRGCRCSGRGQPPIGHGGGGGDLRTAAVRHREVQLETTITDYFHGDGFLNEAKYRGDVTKLLDQYRRLEASSTRPAAWNPKKRQ
jgi:hypothetical protein